jgi:phosphoribosylformylglycinamidine (FGAM) synthase-like enzyme
VRSAHDSAEGGVAVALAESCISGGRGATIQLPANVNIAARWDHILFAEGGARILVSIPKAQVAAWESYLAEQLTDHWQRLGTVGEPGDDLTLTQADGSSLLTVSLEAMDTTWQTAIPRRLED